MSRSARGNDQDLELSERAAALAGLARRALGQMPPAEQVRGLVALRTRLDGRRRQLLWSLSLAVVGLGAAAVVLGPRIWLRAVPSPPLAYRLEGGALGADGHIEAAATARPALRFDDGTVISLEPGTKGRLAEVDGHGAHLAIADGTAAVDVVPRPHARWRIDAGPFVINVHGTVFTAAWHDADGRLDVRMERGLISVEGPVTGGPIAVHAGQRLTVALRQGRVLLRALDDRRGDDDDGAAEVATVPREPPPGPTLAPPAPAPSPSRSVAHAPRSGRSLSWTAALNAGEFDAIIADAERDLPRALGTVGPDDLAALADAARYRKRDELARRALETERRRFARSPRAADAAFFLGRLDENEGAGLVHALRWYDRYLDEAPNGSYAAEALGRKMIALRELYGVTTARVVADAYVRRFPHGSYAGAAEALRGDPR